MSDKEKYINVLCNIFNYFSIKNENKTIINYIAIGSASHMVKQVDDKFILESKYNQQNPRFLKNLRCKLPHTLIRIFLIDEMLENPPFITQDAFGKFNDAVWKERFNNYGDLIKVYQHKHEKLIIYACNFNVYYYLQKENCLNIEPFFNKINECSTKNNWFSVIHDFSGTDISNKSFAFDNELKSHINHIIYGLGYRNNNDSYINVDDDLCDFYYLKCDQYEISVLNPYNKLITPEYIENILIKEVNYKEYIKKLIEIMLASNRKYIKNVFHEMYTFLDKHTDNVFDNELIKKIITSLFLQITHNNKNFNKQIENMSNIINDKNYIEIINNFCDEFNKIYYPILNM